MTQTKSGDEEIVKMRCCICGELDFPSNLEQTPNPDFLEKNFYGPYYRYYHEDCLVDCIDTPDKWSNWTLSIASSILDMWTAHFLEYNKERLELKSKLNAHTCRR